MDNIGSVSSVVLFGEYDRLNRLLDNEDFVGSFFVDSGNDLLEDIKDELVNRYRLMLQFVLDSSCICGR